MPFYDDSVAAGLANAPPESLPVTVPSAPFSKLFDSAMRRENLVGSITESATQPPMGAFDPTFDPWANIKGYEDYARSFVGANNADDVLHIKARIDKEKRDDELLSNGGWRGALALLAAGTLDPVNLIPLGQVRAVTRAGRALEGAVRGGIAMGAGTALQEVGLQGTQITRPASESLLNVGSGTVLGGVLGGAVGALTRPTAQTLRHLGDSSAVGGMIFDRELAANLPGRRNLEEAAEVYDAPAIQRATAAAGGDAAKVAEDLRVRIDQELSSGGIVEHRNQGGEKVRINSIDEAGVLTDVNGARLTLDDVTGPGHSLEIRAPVEAGRAFGAAVEDPLALNLRGELSAARAAEIRDTIAGLDPEEVARLREAGVPVDPEMWKVLADNLEKAEASREGGIEVVIDQAQYLRPGGDLDTISEREAFAAINRAMQAEVARGGDPSRFLDDAIAAGLGADARLPGWAADWKSRLLYAMPTPEVQARGALVGQLAGVRGPIVDEVARVLTTAGRPEREARLYGQLLQVRYGNRAALRELGESAEELFRRDFPGVARGEAGGELRVGELAQAPNETKGHPEGDAEDAAWRRLEPERTAAGKFVGAPDWVTNGRRLGQLRRLIMQLINEGAPGRFWYEDSARRIAQITRGNLPESEKLIGLVAIYSPQTAVFTNMGFAIKAYNQWKRGEPINVKTGSQDARAQAWLDRGEDWGGRKTNSFYLNLMHDIITEHPEALPQLNLPADVLTEIRRATVDLWVLRALGYTVDAAGGEMAGGRTKYAFSEREIQRATGMLNRDLAPGERRWLPHQVQAALWSAIKARYEIPEVKQTTIAESIRRGFSRMAPGEDGVERWQAPPKNGPEKQGHMEIWRKHALKAPVEEVARMVETARGSFGDAIDRIAQNVTGEAVPSASLGHAINNASPEARLQFTRDALRLLIDDDGNDTLAAQLGVNLNFNHLGAGLFEGNINPTVVSTLVPEKPAGFFDATKARQYARAWQYIFRQDAVPIFRADVTAGAGDYFVLNAAGKARRNFRTQEAAQAYADRFIARGETRTVHGDKLALGIKLIFSEDLDEPALRRIADALLEELGPNAGFTKTGDRDVAFINYRDADSGLPAISDARFADAIARIRDREDLRVSDSVRFGSEGEYGPIHDWSADPSGRALQAGIPGRPDLQSWVADRAAAFHGLLDDWADPDARLAAGTAERERIATGERAEPAAAAGDGSGEGGAAGVRSLREAQRVSEEAAAGYPKLRGLPDAPMKVGSDFYVPGPFAKAKEAALSYMRRAGLTYAPPRDYVTVDRVRASRIAELFEQMEHLPDDPRVRASYEALAKETLDQWQAIKETGLVVEWIKPGQADPYGVSPRLAIMDVIDNNHWWGFPTDLGYGTLDDTARAGNPMLQLTDEVVDGRRLLVNDVFRIVHDYFGHIKEGVGFRASGEENAWRQHAAMYSELARGAMTSETRGQNSWVNFGPHGEVNRTANAADTIYSPQKIGLLPEWVWNEGRLDAGELEQAGRGKIRLSTESERALITLFRDADASTFGHEIAHHWLTELFSDAALPKAPAALRKHADDVRTWLGLEEGAPISVEAQEKWATGFEQYLREGRAPTPELASAFAQFREWLVKIYQTITGLGEPISPEVRALYDRFLTAEEKDGMSAAGGSLSAASPFASIDQETVASALGIEKALVRVSPTLRTGTSPSVETRRISMALADQPLDLKKNVEGVPTAQSAESLIKQFQGPLAEAEVGVDDLFTQYRLGRSRRMFDIARLEARDMFGAPEGAMSYSEFREAVGRAMRRGDEATQPEVAEAAKLLRRKVFDPLKQRAIEAGLMPDDIDTKTAESYLMRVYNSNKIVAQRGQFSDVITRWLASEQAKKDTIRTRVVDLVDEYNELSDRVARREGQVEGRAQTLRETEIRREEASRFNAFAYRRAQQLSEPIDALRANIRRVETRIAPQLERLEELRTAIAAEKDRFPQLREIDAAMYRLIGAGQKLRQGEELVDLVRDSDEVVSAIEEVRASIRGGIRELSQERTTARQALGAFDLVELERTRTELGQTIRPYREELRRLQGELRDQMARRAGPARGGAVFETEIRRRGNVLADQASGREAAIEAIEQRLAADQARIAEIRDELEDLVTSWEGKTSQAAKSALARRAEAEAERTTEQPRLASADRAVIAAAEAIANANTRLEEGDLRDIARQIIDRILGSPVGRLPYDVEVPHPSGGPPRPDRAAPRGPLAQRSFMIPDELIEPWLESDSREIARMYTRTMAPDVVLAERFGRTDMEAQLQQIQEAYERLRQGKSEAEQIRLHNQMQADLRDIAAMRDRLRGTYALPADPNGLGNRAFHVVRDLNYLRLLGGMTISAIPDMGRLVMQHGFGRVFSDAIVPMLTGFREFRLAANEGKLAGTALDMVLDTRAMSMADMLDDYGRWSKYERGLKGLTDRFGIVSLMAPWNSAMKQIAGVIGQTRTLEAVEALVAGQPLRQAERTRLASLGISPEMAERIDAQFKTHGEKQSNGTWWANSQDWTDRDAIEIFRSALNKEIDTTIVTKGQEVPLWMSGGGTLLPGNVGKMIGQFRSFGLASAQRVMMAGLQKRDMATLNGALLMVGLGMMVYAARYYTNPKAQPLPDPTTPGGLARWIREGVDISGLTGYLFDIHNMIEKASGGGVGISRLTGGPAQSRYANRNTLESILGPTAGLVQDAGQLLGAATKGEWSAGDSSRVRRMIPFQNLIGLRHLFDAAEHGVNQTFGIREPPPPRASVR